MRVFHAYDVDETEYPRVSASTASTASKQNRGMQTPQEMPWTCLLLSIYNDRINDLSESAKATGWKSLEASSVGEALRFKERWQTQLAIIDFGTMPEKQKETFRKFAVKYLAETNSLLIVCDQEPTPASELWARKIGSWLYLPDADLKEGIRDLYKEAIVVAEKMGLAPATLTTKC